MQNISWTDLVGTLVDALRGIRIVELVELPVDAEMAPKIESGIEPKSLEYRCRVIGASQVEGGPYLEVERASRSRRNLCVQLRTVPAKSTSKHE